MSRLQARSLCKAAKYSARTLNLNTFPGPGAGLGEVILCIVTGLEGIGLVAQPVAMVVCVGLRQFNPSSTLTISVADKKVWQLLSVLLRANNLAA